MTDPDYYAILELEPTASRQQIEMAYEALATRFQPDPDQPAIEPEKMRLVNEAFDTLDDPELRAAYNQAHGLPDPPAPAKPQPLDLKTLAAGAIVLAGTAALVAGIVLAVIVIVDNGTSYVQLASGLKYRDLAEGAGDIPPDGALLTVHYTGTLEDGTQFSTTVGGDPFQFRLGRGEVIKGWDEGVASMRVGGRRELIIPPDLAYGEQGIGNIPPNATLTFEIQLLDFETEDSQ